jgi:carboxymethylenebutenolidase
MIHEWWGLNDNIKDMATELASHGFVVLAVDLFGGEVAYDANKAMELVGSFEKNIAIANMNLGTDFLTKNYNVEKIGSIGWCFGGGQSLNLALNNENMDATVIYYGQLTSEQDQLSSIDWPILGIFAELDQGISPDIVKEFESALNNLEIPNEIIIYPGVDHAFANPTGARFAPIESADAWDKTLNFLESNLK